jgi:hypothetical protein
MTDNIFISNDQSSDQISDHKSDQPSNQELLDFCFKEFDRWYLSILCEDSKIKLENPFTKEELIFITKKGNQIIVPKHIHMEAMIMYNNSINKPKSESKLESK